MTQQVATVSGRVEDAVQAGVAAGERVVTNVQKRWRRETDFPRPA